MEYIYDNVGNVIRYSCNGRGIRRYLSEPGVIVAFVSISELPNGEGILFIRFTNGYYYNSTYASYRVLQSVVRRWRNLYGARLISQGRSCGVVQYNNPTLWAGIAS